MKNYVTFCKVGGGGNFVAPKSAFTLAEVLITLGIIGVVAALTMPSVISSIKGKQYETAMKKGYSVLSQALIKMNEEEGIIANQTSYPSSDSFAPVYKKYFTLLNDCGQEDCEALGKDEEGALDRISDVYRTYNGRTNARNALFDEGQFMLPDGMFVMVNNDGSIPIMISIDVNGYGKGPNKWGHDLFTFQIMNDTRKLVPMGADGTLYNDERTYCSKTSMSSLNGVACAYKAFTDSDYFKSLP